MLKIAPFSNFDAPIILNWPQNETEFYWWSAGKFGTYPATPETVTEFYKNPDNRFCNICSVYDDNGLCGHYTLRFLDDSHKRLRLGFIILNPDCRGKGYGKAMLTLALNDIKERFPKTPISLGVFADNTPAIRCYQSLGFQFTGEEETVCLPYDKVSYKIMELK